MISAPLGASRKLSARSAATRRTRNAASLFIGESLDQGHPEREPRRVPGRQQRDADHSRDERERHGGREAVGEDPAVDRGPEGVDHVVAQDGSGPDPERHGDERDRGGLEQDRLAHPAPLAAESAQDADLALALVDRNDERVEDSEYGDDYRDQELDGLEG